MRDLIRQPSRMTPAAEPGRLSPTAAAGVGRTVTSSASRPSCDGLTRRVVALQSPPDVRLDWVQRKAALLAARLRGAMAGRSIDRTRTTNVQLTVSTDQALAEVDRFVERLTVYFPGHAAHVRAAAWRWIARGLGGAPSPELRARLRPPREALAS